jgi:hypothetical protein
VNFDKFGNSGAGRRQVAQHGFQLLADVELHPRAGFHPKIIDRPDLPVNVPGGQVGDVALRRDSI